MQLSCEGRLSETAVKARKRSFMMAVVIVAFTVLTCPLKPEVKFRDYFVSWSSLLAMCRHSFILCHGAVSWQCVGVHLFCVMEQSPGNV